MEMDHIYGNVCEDKTESYRASQATLKATTKVQIPLLIIGAILLLGVAVLGTLTYKYASKLSDEQKKFALMDAQYKNISAVLNNTDAQYKDLLATYNISSGKLSDEQKKFALMDAQYKDISAVLNNTAECSCRACPEGWKHHKGKCYLFSSSKMNWEGSRDHCITLGGHLIIVNNQEEQNFLAAQAKGVSHWIGLNDRAVEGQWRWVDNISLNETGAIFWYKRSDPNQADEPDNWKKEDPLGENCASIYLTADWHDNSCKTNYPFVCETLASS
ncbi:C-type lectin domain family 4 member E-like isoform X2 [Sardina pilchardus]|uniref:C-type lectin domain family 4 member E-like isoform X2 n=1 Tax=Sardina pilchardus TaxID=27697 RepID=UPI002E117BA9